MRTASAAFALLLAGAGAEAPPTAHLTHASADQAQVERILRASEVEREPASPSPGAYLGHVVERFARALADLLGSMGRALRKSGLDPRLLAWAILLLALGAAGLALASALRGRGRRRARPTTVETRPAADIAARLRDRDAWGRELERRLERGEIAAALEALWWWLARSLSGAMVEASWTSHELLARAQRMDLAPLAASLDGLVYGAARPGVEDVRQLAGRIRAALP